MQVDKQVQMELLVELMKGAPAQPATNLWRCVEVPMLAAALPRQGKALDLGCGDGVLTRAMQRIADANWTLIGIDPDPSECVLARQTGIYEEVYNVGADSVPLADGSVDFAFANSVLEHIPKLSQCLPEIARVLKTGGQFLATVPSPYFHQCLRGPGWTWRCTRDEYLRQLDQRLHHFHYWTVEQWRQELDTAGLELVAIDSYLTQRQGRRWEFLSNWTGGLVYRLKGSKSHPIELQRNMGLRRPLPVWLNWTARPVSWLVSLGFRGGTEPDAAKNCCFLISARRREREENSHGDST